MKKKNIQNNGLSNVKNIRELRPSLPFTLAPFPAVRLLVVVIAGILAGVNLAFSLKGWLVLSLLSLFALLGALLYEKIKQTGPFPTLFSLSGYTLFLFLCFASLSSFRFGYAPCDGLLRCIGKTVLLYGRVDERPYTTEKGTSFSMDVEEVFLDGRSTKIHERVKVFIRNSGSPGKAILYGDMVRLKGALDLIPGAANKGEFDPAKSAQLKQLSAQLYCAGPWQVLHEGERRLNLLERFVVIPVHDYIMKSLEELIRPGEERKLAVGVLTGERESLSEEVIDAFKLTGTAHILAVSGLNVTLLALCIHLALQRLKVTTAGRWFSFLIILFILLVYSNVTGNSASVQRAAIMTAVLIGGETLGRKSYPINSLALADLLILLLDPLDLLNPGFLMTNGAVLAILLIYPRFISEPREGGGLIESIGHFFLSSIMVTVAAIIGVSPVIAFYFGTFSLISFLANIPVVLFSTLLMYDLVPMLLFNLVSEQVASLFAASSIFLAELTLQSALWFSRFPFASISVRPDGVEVWLYYLLLAALLFFGYQKAWGKVLLSLLLGLNMLFWYSFFLQPLPVAPDVVTVNLGKNLATIYSSGSETVLIDAGRAPRDYERISQQLEVYGLAVPDAVIQFYSPDTLLVQVPVRKQMLRESTKMLLSSVLIVRPEEKVLKLWSRKNSLLMISGTNRLKAEEFYKADILFLWSYRFGEKQQQELQNWLNYARPKHCILVPGSFLPRTHLAAMRRFAATHPGVELRYKTRQVVVR